MRWFIALALGACWRGDPPPASAPPPIEARARDRWSGSCDGSEGWQVEVALDIKLRIVGDDIRIAGTAGWEDRRVRLRASGRRAAAPPHKLTGEFAEIAGLGTTWNITIELDRDGPRGRLYEETHDGTELICAFDFVR